MKIAFLNFNLQTQMAAKYLVEKHNFKSFSIMETLESIKDKYFQDIKDENFIRKLKFSFEEFDKYSLIKNILEKANKYTNVVIPDISTINEYYFSLMEGFIPLKFDSNDKCYESILDTIPIVTIKKESNIDHFYESLDFLIANYNTIEQNKYKGGVIQYAEE